MWNALSKMTENLIIAIPSSMPLARLGAEAALMISIAYIIQVRSTAWYVKYADRIFK